MLRSLPLVTVVLLFGAVGITYSLSAQEQTQEKASSVAAAKEISAATGRPIFALAGRGT